MMNTEYWDNCGGDESEEILIMIVGKSNCNMLLLLIMMTIKIMMIIVNHQVCVLKFDHFENIHRLDPKLPAYEGAPNFRQVFFMPTIKTSRISVIIDTKSSKSVKSFDWNKLLRIDPRKSPTPYSCWLSKDWCHNKSDVTWHTLNDDITLWEAISLCDHGFHAILAQLLWHAEG